MEYWNLISDMGRVVLPNTSIAFLEKEKNLSSLPSATFWHEWSLILSAHTGRMRLLPRFQGESRICFLAQRVSEWMSLISPTPSPGHYGPRRGQSTMQAAFFVLRGDSKQPPPSWIDPQVHPKCAGTASGERPPPYSVPAPGWTVLALALLNQTSTHISRRVVLRKQRTCSHVMAPLWVSSSLTRAGRSPASHGSQGTPLSLQVEGSAEAGCSGLRSWWPKATRWCSPILRNWTDSGVHLE